MRSLIVLQRVNGELRKVLWVLVVTLWIVLPAYSQLAVPLTVQEALYPNAPTAGIARTQDPVTVGVPIADSSAITSTSQLGLAGATVGQFRVLGRWPSGNIMWVLVDTQADLPAGGKNTSIFLTTGSGNFGGPNLAVDNGSSIAVNTGPAQFTIRKARFNLFDSVTVNGRQLVTPGTSAGLVMMGPAPGATSCGVCNVAYSSANDLSSTSQIEENGPARVVIKAIGSHVDSTGHAYMHYTVRMSFYKGKSYAKVEVILRNADETSNTAGDFNSAFKGFASYEARITPALGAARNFNIGTDSSTSVSGAFSGTESAYLYQAYSKDMEISDWNVSNCTPTLTGRCTASYIARTPVSGSMGSYTYTYAQDGYQIVHGSSVLLQRDHTKYPQGWADLSDSTGAGIEVGVYQLSAYWPKSLQFVNGGSEVRVGIWPDQSLFHTGGGQPYYQAWPQYSIHDLFFDFHNTTLSSAANTFLAFQHSLLARANLSQYNQAAVFAYPLIDPSAEDNYFRSLKVACCMRDVTPKIYRYFGWQMPGAGNQHELRWSYLRNFLERGLPGRYLLAAHFYRMVTEHGFPRSDGFDWRNHPISQLDPRGFPTIASANNWLSFKDWIDDEHAHWYGMTDYYFMTGDETAKDQLLDGVKDRYLNAQSQYNTGLEWDTRDIGAALMSFARLYQSFTAIGDPDANKTLSVADQVLNTQVFPELQVSSFGTSKQGISRTRGIHFGCCQHDTESGGYSGRVTNSFHVAILEEGLYELAQARGPSWSKYDLAMDLIYGMARWSLSENWTSTAGQTPSATNSGWRYMLFLDQANNSTYSWWYKPSVVATNWFHFFALAAYSGDTSWKQNFDWYLMRTSANGGLVEFGSHIMEASLSVLLTPPASSLVSVPVTTSSNGTGSYTLHWTVPRNATGYRIKYEPGKNVVDWLYFDPGSNTYAIDPNHNWPWFSSLDVPNPPAPAAAGTTQSFTVSGISAGSGFAVKAYVPGPAAPGSAGFLVTTSSGAQSVSAGQAASYTITVRPANGSFVNPVLLACGAGVPPGTTCSFSPSALTPGSNAVSSILTISTTTSSAHLLPLPRQHHLPLFAFWLSFPGVAFVGTLGAGGSATRSKPGSYALLVLMLVLLVFLVACGGGAANGPASGTGPAGGVTVGSVTTPAGTYSVQVTATSGTAQQATNVTLVVR
jgi:hypothetical protein